MKHLFRLTDTFLSQFLQEVFRRRRFPLPGVDFKNLFTRLKHKTKQTFSWVDWESTKGQIKINNRIMSSTFSVYCELWEKMSPLCPAVRRGTPCRSVRAAAAPGRWSPAGSSLRSPRPRLGCPTRPSEPGASTRWSCRTDVIRTYFHCSSFVMDAHLLLFSFILFSPVDLVLPAGSDRSQTVDLVKEDDGRTHLVRLRTTHTNTHEVVKMSDGGNTN